MEPQTYERELGLGFVKGLIKEQLSSTFTVSGPAKWETSPSKRKAIALEIRTKAALKQFFEPTPVHHNNGDEEAYPERWGNFHKTLPHDPVDGSVDPVAYNQFLAALQTGKFSDFEAIPKGTPNGSKILNPLGAGVYGLYGPDAAGLPVTPPPSISSKEFGSAMTEMYWMALARDIPFAHYEAQAQDPTSFISEALLDLNEYGAAYPAPKTNGLVTYQDLFRLDLPGSRKGPIVSQFLFKDYSIDGINVDARINQPVLGPAGDFVTNWDDFIAIQNGGAPLGSGIPLIPNGKIYPATVRHLGYIAGSDLIYSVPNRALMILRSAASDINNPYNSSTRQSGFSTFGLAHYTHLMGASHMAERPAWYAKWIVNRYLRPEAAGGLVHARFYDNPPRNDTIPLDADIATKRALTHLKNRFDSYLLPIMFKNGGPTHPSFTAGHAISIGAGVTLLKALFDTSKTWKEVFGQPKYSETGATLVDYVGPDADTLTIGDELNKLAHNLSIGRDMSGVHWRADDVHGLAQGEEAVIRILREEKAGYVEAFEGFTLTKFDGEVITI